MDVAAAQRADIKKVLEHYRPRCPEKTQLIMTAGNHDVADYPDVPALVDFQKQWIDGVQDYDPENPPAMPEESGTLSWDGTQIQTYRKVRLPKPTSFRVMEFNSMFFHVDETKDPFKKHGPHALWKKARDEITTAAQGLMTKVPENGWLVFLTHIPPGFTSVDDNGQGWATWATSHRKEFFQKLGETYASLGKVVNVLFVCGHMHANVEPFELSGSQFRTKVVVTTASGSVMDWQTNVVPSKPGYLPSAEASENNPEELTADTLATQPNAGFAYRDWIGYANGHRVEAGDRSGYSVITLKEPCGNDPADFQFEVHNAIWTTHGAPDTNAGKFRDEMVAKATERFNDAQTD